MYKAKGKFRMIVTICAFVAIGILIVFSDVCKTGIERGIVICGNVIIPSLFPFTVCVLMIMNMNITVKNKLVLKTIYYIFGQNFEMFCVMFFSMLGGYPVGSKLINELFSQNKINKKTANIMQMYCVNAGPAFIITAVGCGVLGSKNIGIILFVSHISASFIVALCTSKFIRKNLRPVQEESVKQKSFSETFVASTADAASSVMSVCVYVILFSCINSYVVYFGSGVPLLENVIFFTEITSGITYTKNIIFISFLLGFSGISIWCQIFSLSKNAKPDLKLFVLGRILHGGLSGIITCFLLKLFKIKQTVFSNLLIAGKKMFYDNISISISLAVMVIVLLICIYTKNSCRKMIDDVI